jgi:hypothetical protein
MPRVNSIRLTIITGTAGTTSEVRVKFNGHTLPLTVTKGGTGPGQTYEGGFDVGSFCHSCALLGPESGEWRIARVVASFEGAEPRKVELTDRLLKAGAEENIWDPPPAALDV